MATAIMLPTEADVRSTLQRWETDGPTPEEKSAYANAIIARLETPTSLQGPDDTFPARMSDTVESVKAIDRMFLGLEGTFKSLAADLGTTLHPQLVGFCIEWTDFRKRWSHSLQQSRWIASVTCNLLARFDEFCITKLENIQSDDDRLDAIQALKDFVEESDSQDYSNELSRALLDLKRDMSVFLERFHTFIYEGGVVTSTMTSVFKSQIDNLVAQIEELNRQIMRCHGSLSISGNVSQFFCMGIGSPVLYFLAKEREEKMRNLENSKNFLATFEHDRQPILTLKISLDVWKPDLDLLITQLLALAEIWSSVRSQAVQFRGHLEGGVGAVRTMRLKVEVRLARAVSIPLMQGVAMIFKFLALLFSTSLVTATPVKRAQPDLMSRQENSDTSQKSGLSPSVWIPIVVAALVLVGVALLSWSNRRIRRLILPGVAASSGQGQNQTTRELTAAELAGTINTGPGATNAAVTQPAARTRRTRRPRRTPSQMSVTSLPEYNKEPGEQELVIFRGQDMEDVAIARVDEVDEDGDSSMHSRDRSQSSAYSPVPPSLNDPLLEGDTQRVSRSASSNSRRSTRNQHLPHSSEEGHGLMQNEIRHSETTAEPRGEAPPYFEVDTLPPQSEVQPTASYSGPPTTVSPPASPERRSGIRTFFNRMSVVGAPRGLGHARIESGTSYVSSSQSHGDPISSASSSRHRPSPSNGSSFFRTLSRQRSQSTLHSANASARLNSPSLISLNSISSPLTHTLTRTEITYPKTGPTPEQLKIISSRESITRFGVPYGRDALAFASTSLLDVTQPPPDFDTATGASASALSLNNGNTSRVSLHARGDSSGAARATSPLAQPDRETENIDQLALSSNTEQSPMASILPLTGKPSSLQPDGEGLSSSPNAEARSSSIVSKASTYQSLAPSILSSLPSPSVSEFGKLTAPPSAFSFDQSAASYRSESRASARSYQSYATAAESMATRGGNAMSATSDSEGDDKSEEPGTPIASPKPELLTSSGMTAVAQHKKEETDATIIPSQTPNPFASASSN